MPASIRPNPKATPASLAAALVLACGLSWGLGLARALYERAEGGAAFLGQWPGALALAALTAALAAVAWLAATRLTGAPRAALATAFLPLALPLVALLNSAVNPLRMTALLAGGTIASICFCLIAGGAESVERGASRFSHYIPPLLTFLLPFLLYLRTLAPTVGEADTFEFQVDSLRLAVAHPSGYPLYILIGKLFSLLPLPGSPAYRINLSAAFFGALAALGVYEIVRAVCRLGSEEKGTKGSEGNSGDESRNNWDALPALTAGLTFGLSFGLWSRAVEAEVYTLNAAFVAAILFVSLMLVGLRSDEGGRAGGAKDVSGVAYHVSRITHYASAHPIPLLFFLVGLSLTNHLTTGLLLPAVVAALLITRPRLPWRTWLAAVGLFALGLSVYLYIPIRWPAVNNGQVMSLAQFAGFITGQQAQGALRLNAWVVDPGRYAVVGSKVLGEFGWPGALLALTGLGWLAARRQTRPVAAVLLLAYAAYFYFGLSFYVPDPDFSSFLLPAHLIECVLVGLGVAALGRGVVTHYVLRFSPAIYTAAFLLPLSLIWRNLPRVDQSQDWGKYELGRYILSQPLAEGALLLADSEKIAPLYYLQVAEGARPDLTISVLPDEAAYRAAMDAGIAAGRTVYLARYLPGLQGFFHLRSLGPVTEVGTAPLLDAPPSEASLDVTFGGAIRLIGANLDSAGIAAGEPLRFTLLWQAVAPVDGNYLVRLRLLDGGGQTARQTRGRLPANGFYPTNAWQAGEIVPDFYQVDVDTSLAPGTYSLEAGLFPPFSDDGLPVEGGGDEAGRVWARVAAIDVGPAVRKLAIPTPVRFDYGWAKHPDGADANAESSAGASPLQAIRLLGYDLPASAAPG